MLAASSPLPWVCPRTSNRAACPHARRVRALVIGRAPTESTARLLEQGARDMGGLSSGCGGGACMQQQPAADAAAQFPPPPGVRGGVHGWRPLRVGGAPLEFGPCRHAPDWLADPRRLARRLACCRPPSLLGRAPGGGSGLRTAGHTGGGGGSCGGCGFGTCLHRPRLHAPSIKCPHGVDAAHWRGCNLI